MKKKFNLLIKHALKENKISLRELARRSSLDVSFLSKILSGYRNPPSAEKDIMKIAQALKIGPEKLVIAAGKIPAGLEGILNDDEVINNLLSLQTKGGVKKKYVSVDKTFKKDVKEEVVHSRAPEIEDELL